MRPALSPRGGAQPGNLKSVRLFCLEFDTDRLDCGETREQQRLASITGAAFGKATSQAMQSFKLSPHVNNMHTNSRTVLS